MGRRMAATVVTRHPETGEPAVLAAGTDAPDWAADVITNEDVYEAKAPAKAKADDGDAPKAPRKSPAKS